MTDPWIFLTYVKHVFSFHVDNSESLTSFTAVDCHYCKPEWCL